MKNLFIFIVLSSLTLTATHAEYKLPESDWIKLDNNLYIDQKNIYKTNQDRYIKFFSKFIKENNTEVLRVQLIQCTEKRIGTKTIIEMQNGELISSNKNKKVKYQDISEYSWDEKLYKYLCK